VNPQETLEPAGGGGFCKLEVKKKHNYFEENEGTRRKSSNSQEDASFVNSDKNKNIIILRKLRVPAGNPQTRWRRRVL